MAGHDPEVVKVRGLGIGPRFMQVTTEGRKEVEQLTGQRTVPVLVTDEGEVDLGLAPDHRVGGGQPGASLRGGRLRDRPRSIARPGLDRGQVANV